MQALKDFNTSQSNAGHSLTNVQPSSLLNGRYQKVSRIGEGSYGTVFLALDTKPEGIRRKIDRKYLQLLDKAGANNNQLDESGDQKMSEQMKEEQKNALQTLGNPALLFNKNDAFDGSAAQQQNTSESQSKGPIYVAIKKFKMNSHAERNGIPFSALREVNMLQEMNHAHIVDIYDVFYVNKTIFLVLEYVPYVLTKLIHDTSIMLKEEHVKNIMHQMLSAIDYLHSNYVMHRDLGPGNLLIHEDGTIKLADFGLAKPFGTPEKAHSTGVVTRFYRSPEILFGASYYGPKVDMWSAGCVFGELLIRAPLFPGTNDIDQLGKIFTVRGTPNLEDWPGVDELPNYLEFTIKQRRELKEIFPFASAQCLDLMDKLLQLNPNKRISARDALNHPYFTEEEPKACSNKDLPLPVKKQ